MNDFVKDIMEKCPPDVTGKILAFNPNSWVEPENFINLKIKQREALKSRLYRISEPLAKDNMWVWFGSFSNGVYKQPRIDGVSVKKILYTKLINPMLSPDTRLYTPFEKYPYDVNPYFVAPQGKLSRTTLADYIREQSGVDVRSLLSEKDKQRYKKLIDKCLKDMEEYYCPNNFFMKSDMTKILSNKHSMAIIEEAYKLTELPLV